LPIITLFWSSNIFTFWLIDIVLIADCLHMNDATDNIALLSSLMGSFHFLSFFRCFFRYFIFLSFAADFFSFFLSFPLSPPPDARLRLFHFSCRAFSLFRCRRYSAVSSAARQFAHARRMLACRVAAISFAHASLSFAITISLSVISRAAFLHYAGFTPFQDFRHFD